MRAEDVLACLRLTAPADRRELADWVRIFCGLHMPAKACCAHHDTPLDYLAYVFFEQEKAADCVVWACRGGGKTMLGAVATLLDLLFRPGIEVRILAGSFEQSQKMYDYLLGLARRSFADQLEGEPTQRTMRLKNGSRVVVLPQSDRAVRGMRVQRVRCDEVELFEPEIWSAVQMTTRSHGQVRASVEALSTMHVPGGLMEQTMGEWTRRGKRTFTWCVWDVIERCPEARACDGCALWDACGGRAKGAEGFVPIEDVIAMRERISESAWRHELLCESPKREDAVFQMFDVARHVRAWPGEDGDVFVHEGARYRREGIVCGVDFGFAQAFVCLWLMKLTRADGARCFWVVDEQVLKHTRLEAAIGQMKGHTLGMPRVVHADPAGWQINSQTGMSDVRLLQGEGFTVKTQRSTVLAGCDRIRALLAPASGETRLWIDPRCERLIMAMRAYRCDARGEPVKDGTHDHPVDALRYAVSGEMGASGGVRVRWY